jgi:aminodeoxyfutalosine synthase
MKSASFEHLSALRLRDPHVETARRTLLDGGRLGQEDGVPLWRAGARLGRLADAMARDRHGERVYFTVNRQLNPTNVCVLS